MIIDDMQGNLNSSNKIGLEYKVKFIIYVLILISRKIVSNVQIEIYVMNV